MDNKKTMNTKVTRLDEEQAQEIITAVIEAANKHTEELVAKLDKKSVVISKKDVKESVREILEEQEQQKAEQKKKEEAKKKEEETKKAEPEDPQEEEEDEILHTIEVNDDCKVKLKFSIKTALKYVGIGFAGAATGALGKTAYDKVQERKRTKQEEAEPVAEQPEYDI